MATMRDIKRRKNSIQSTQQITKAMKLVSTVKLQKARTRAEEAKPYFECMYKTVQSMLGRAGDIQHPYLKSGASEKKAVVAITSNRGLAGGYNSNVTKLVAESGLPREQVQIYAVGRKGYDAFKRWGYEIKGEYSDMINEPLFDDAAELSKALLQAFADEEIGEIYLAYTSFKNTVSHEPKMIKILPVEPAGEQEEVQGSHAVMEFEPHEEEALGLIIPKYVTSLIYGAFIEAVASENGARMQAMDSATNNAEEMINDLSLKYNRARQGSITQELTEIIAGAEAIS